jgi:hypothetical protein
VQLKTSIFILLFISSFGITKAQRLSPGTHDFGKVKLWNNPTATFVFKNNTKERIIFLPIRYQRDMKIALPEGFIEPGEKVEILARFYTEKLGSFTIDQELYVNVLNEPLHLRIKGKILSFHPNALTVCPILDKTPAEKRAENNTISSLTVYNHKTGLTVDGYDVIMKSKQERFVLENSTNAMVPLSKIPLGLYEIVVSKEGYYTDTRLIYINKNSRPITFELEPIEGVVRKTHNKPINMKSKNVFMRVETEKEAEMADIERIRAMMNEKYKDRKIIEKDVLVINETTQNEDSIIDIEPIDPDISLVDQEDLVANGTLNAFKYLNNNVVFLIDVSSSMGNKNKLEMLKVSMKNLVDVLRKEDQVTIVTYSSRAKVILSSIPGNEKDAIKQVIDSLKAFGQSHGAEGMSVAYEYAESNFIKGGNNQIILATDGLFNSKDHSDNALYSMASDKSWGKIHTSVIGFGKDKKAITFMEKLAKNGKGNYMHVLTFEEANSALISEIQSNSLISE